MPDEAKVKAITKSEVTQANTVVFTPPLGVLCMVRCGRHEAVQSNVYRHVERWRRRRRFVNGFFVLWQGLAIHSIPVMQAITKASVLNLFGAYPDTSNEYHFSRHTGMIWMRLNSVVSLARGGACKYRGICTLPFSAWLGDLADMPSSFLAVGNIKV